MFLVFHLPFCLTASVSICCLFAWLSVSICLSLSVSFFPFVLQLLKYLLNFSIVHISHAPTPCLTLTLFNSTLFLLFLTTSPPRISFRIYIPVCPDHKRQTYLKPLILAECDTLPSSLTRNSREHPGLEPQSIIL